MTTVGPTVEIVWEEGCPNVDAARDVVREALRRAELPEQWREWDRGDAETPVEIRGYGSPTILVDRVDVADTEPAGASCCRVYQQDDGSFAGVPEVDTLVDALTG